MPIAPVLPLNINKNSKEILFDLLNVENSSNLNYFEFELSEPQIDALQNSSINTSIVLTPLSTSSFYNNVKIYYKRMSIEEIINNSQVEILVTNETLLSQLIPQINSKYGINLTTDDYFDIPFTYMQDGQIIPLEIKNNSLLFYGIGQLILGHKPQVVENTGKIRQYYLIKESLNPNFTNEIISFDSTLNPSLTFSFLRNCNNVINFRIDQAFILSNLYFILKGQFDFDVTLSNAVNQTISAQTLKMDKKGNIVGFDVNLLFGPLSLTKYFTNKNIDRVYVLDHFDTLGSRPHKVYSFNNDGILDLNFNPVGLSYIPTLLKVSNNGKIYTVSPQYLDLINGINYKKIRIDRWLNDGSMDANFEPIVIESTGSADVTPVIDIVLNNNAGGYVLLNPIHGVSSGSFTPIVNQYRFVSGSDPTDGSFNPIFRFNEDGTMNYSFSSKLFDFSEKSIFDYNYVFYSTGMNPIVCSTNTVSYITVRNNPLTGVLHKAIVSYSETGKPYILNGDYYLNDIRWSDANKIISNSSDEIIIAGAGQVKLNTGAWSNTRSILAIYSKKSEIKKIVWQNNNAINLLDFFLIEEDA